MEYRICLWDSEGFLESMIVDEDIVEKQAEIFRSYGYRVEVTPEDD